MELTGKIIPVPIEDEIKESYLNYAMSVIISRALPDVRDGLKPVHRRILYAMHEMGLRHDREFKKCGRIVGDVLGKYHPHGDQSIYDALVRLGQVFSMRYPAVIGQGNFGSIDGDPPAAMRYTEAKMHRIAEEMLRDINKETVDFGPNYDDSITEPLVLPANFPFLLVNGASGIAVGMATNIPPHNLEEVCSAISAQIDDPDISIEQLSQLVKGPDFPTGGIIYGFQGIRDAYCTGRGCITVRGKCVLETTKTGRDIIIVHEIPYGVNKASLVVRIAELVRDKKIQGISDLRDESDRNGMRIVIELKKDAISKVVLNQLFTHTQLQQNFNVNALAIVDGKPVTLNLKEIIRHFIEHRFTVITRRSRYDLLKAEERAHILEGLKIALENIDDVIETIKKSQSVNDARENLVTRFKLSEKQAQAILDMRLQKITSLETKKILDELKEVRELITYLEDLLSNRSKIFQLVKEETNEIGQTYRDERRTQIAPDEIEQLDMEDLIKEEDMVVLISNRGFIKRIPVTSYRNQGRGGKGSSSTLLKNDDFIENLFIASTHNYILFVTSEGKAYWLKVYEIPEGQKTSRGVQVKSLLAISPDEEISAVVALNDFSEESFIFMATSKGIIKKVTTNSFRNARTRGIVAINLETGDKLVSALLTDGNQEILLISRRGFALRFSEALVRPMGRSSKGVIGLRFGKGDELSAVLTIRSDEKMIVVTEYGFGKRMSFDLFIPHGRGTKGQVAYKENEKTGEIIGAIETKDDDDFICISSLGNTIKLKSKDIPVMGKNAFGVRTVAIQKPDYIVGIARIINED